MFAMMETELKRFRQGDFIEICRNFQKKDDGRDLGISLDKLETGLFLKGNNCKWCWMLGNNCII